MNSHCYLSFACCATTMHIYHASSSSIACRSGSIWKYAGDYAQDMLNNFVCYLETILFWQCCNQIVYNFYTRTLYRIIRYIVVTLERPSFRPSVPFYFLLLHLINQWTELLEFNKGCHVVLSKGFNNSLIVLGVKKVNYVFFSDKKTWFSNSFNFFDSRKIITWNMVSEISILSWCHLVAEKWH